MITTCPRKDCELAALRHEFKMLQAGAARQADQLAEANAVIDAALMPLDTLGYSDNPRKEFGLSAAKCARAYLAKHQPKEGIE